MRRLISLASALALACSIPFYVRPAMAQTGPVYCNQMSTSFPSSATTTKVISHVASGSQRILICGYVVQATGGTAQIIYGTQSSTACDTGATNISPAFATAVTGYDQSPTWRGLAAPNGNDVCVVTGTGTTAAQIVIFWTYG